MKCNEASPCSDCRKSDAKCIYLALAPPRRGKRRIPEGNLLARLRRYEDLRKAGIDVNLSKGTSNVTDGARSEMDVDVLENAPEDRAHNSEDVDKDWNSEQTRL